MYVCVCMFHIVIFCPNFAPFYTLCFRCHSFHFGADFMALSCTEIVIFPTEKQIALDKKTLLVSAPPV